MGSNIRIGAREGCYALMNESSDIIGGTPTYDTVYALPRLMDKIDINLNGSAATLWGDDAAREIGETVGEIDVSLTLGDLPQADLARILGHTYANGGLAKGTSDVSPYIALGFKVLMTGGQYQYHWLYKLRCVKFEGAHETKKGSVNFQMMELKFKGAALVSNNLYGYTYRTNDDTATAAITAGFFNTVYFPSYDVTALTATIAKGTAGDSGKIVVTFAKGSGASFTVAAAQFAAPNAMVSDTTGLRAGTWSVGGAGTTVVCKFTPTVGFSSESVDTILQGIKDNSGVTVTTVAKVLAF